MAQFKRASVHPHCYLHYLGYLSSVCYLKSITRFFNFNAFVKSFKVVLGVSLYNIDICLLESGARQELWKLGIQQKLFFNLTRLLRSQKFSFSEWSSDL